MSEMTIREFAQKCANESLTFGEALSEYWGLVGSESQSMAQYKIDFYYDLVEVKWKDGVVGHIPVPFFMESRELFEFLKSIQILGKVRDEKFFKGPDGLSFYKDPDMPIRYSVRKNNILKYLAKQGRLPTTVKSVKYIMAVEAFV